MLDKTGNDPTFKSKKVQLMHAKAIKIQDLLGGTDAMRKAGALYLPKEDAESAKSYSKRLNMSVLKPVLKDTLKQMVGRTFANELITEKIADELKGFLHNFNLKGRNIDNFCADWFHDAMAYGASYVVVDFPTLPEARTIADDKKLGVRPYAVHVRNADVLGWKFETRGDKEVCTQFRYQSEVTEPDGLFGEKVYQQITVLESGSVVIYRKTDDGWVEHSKTELSIKGQKLDYVPVVAFVPEPISTFDGVPVLEDLADLNIRHWQLRSDLDYLVHFTSVPLLYYKGEQNIKEITAGVGNLLTIGSDEELGFVEHSGSAIESGTSWLKNLEDDMNAAGAKLLARTKIAMTDSQAKEEKNKEMSLLRHYANLFEGALDQALKLMCLWLGSNSDSHIEISGNLEADNTIDSLNVVLNLHSSDIISKQTTFEEAKRRGVISNQADWEIELKRLESENNATTPPALDFSHDDDKG